MLSFFYPVSHLSFMNRTEPRLPKGSRLELVTPSALDRPPENNPETKTWKLLPRDGKGRAFCPVPMRVTMPRDRRMLI